MVTAKIETIHPDEARELLNTCENYRKLKMSAAKKLARNIDEGQFLLNGESIVIDEDGNLKDGQHRLTAVVLSNKPITAVVVRGISRNTNLFDTGSNRSDQDYFRNCGWDNRHCNNSSTAALRYLAERAGHKNLTKPEVGKIGEALWEQLGDAYMYCSTGSENALMRKSACVAAMTTAMYSGVDNDLILRFCNIVNTGFSASNAQSAAIVYRNLLLSIKNIGGKAHNGRIERNDFYRVGLLALEDFINGNPRRNKYTTDNSKVNPREKAVSEMICQVLKGETA